MKRRNMVHYNLKLTMLGISFLFVLIIAKLIYVAVSNDVDGINLKTFADNRNTEHKTLYASRGTIFDNNGNELAVDANSYTVIAYLSDSRTKDASHPNHVVDKEHTAKSLAPVLEMEESTLLERLSRENLYQINLKLGISENKKNEILALDLPGIDFVKSTKRYYPYGNYASYILGYALTDDYGEIDGKMGLESYYNDTLKGENGWTEYQKDAYGYQMPTSTPIGEESTSGSDIYLTLDQDIQLILENAINQLEDNYQFSWATITVMNAKTGAILGNANNPNFDLNTREDLESYLNPLVSFQYEPGSVMKIFSFMDAIEEGVYDGSKKYLSGSTILKDGTKINDFNNKGWGEIDFDTGFAYSSNVAATHLALELGTNKLKAFYDTLGFGKKTGINLPGEVEGANTFIYESELATAAFGQGRITVTPVQMLQALTSIANDGVMVKPYIVSKIVNEKGETTYENNRIEIAKVASSETINKIKDLMYKVVYDGFESSKKFAPDNVTLIGKTGTAQIANPKGGGYLKGEYDYIKSFAGLFPYEDPEYVVYIAVKQLVGGSNDLAKIVNNVVGEVAKSTHLVEKENDVDETKIIALSDYLSSFVTTTTEKLKQQGFQVVIIGDGKYIINQYPLKNQKVLYGSKVFLLTNSIAYTLPDVTGWSTNEIVTFCNLLGIPYVLNGYGKVVNTNLVAGAPLSPSEILEINLSI